MPVLVRPLGILAQPAGHRASGLFWGTAWPMEPVPTILSLNLVGDIIEELWVKLARKDPEQAVQLLIALLQDQRIVASTPITKGED